MGATMMAAPTSNVAALMGPFFKDTPVLRDKRPIPRSYTMSALPPKADIVQDGRDVRFVPKADTWHWSKFGEDSAHCGREQAAWKRGKCQKRTSMREVLIVPGLAFMVAATG